MWRLDLGQTAMQNPGHFWQLMKPKLIGAVVMMYLWVGRDLWVEGAEQNALRNDRWLPLTCVSMVSSRLGLCWFFSALPASQTFHCAGGVKWCIINIWITPQKKKNMYDLPTGQFSNGWSVYQKTTPSSIQGHFVLRFIDFCLWLICWVFHKYTIWWEPVSHNTQDSGWYKTGQYIGVNDQKNAHD